MPEYKECANCGKNFTRRAGLSQAQWDRARFCTRRCSARKATGQTLLERFFQSVSFDPITKCWLWCGSKDSHGYGLFSVDGVNLKAHRFLFSMAVKKPSDDEMVLHRCDVRSCVNPYHLFLGTHQDNVDDMLLKGRDNPARGEASGSARLTEEEVRGILADPRSQAAIAAAYQIAQTTVSKIKTKKTWRTA